MKTLWQDNSLKRAYKIRQTDSKLILTPAPMVVRPYAQFGSNSSYFSWFRMELKLTLGIP